MAKFTSILYLTVSIAFPYTTQENLENYSNIVTEIEKNHQDIQGYFFFPLGFQTIIQLITK